MCFVFSAAVTAAPTAAAPTNKIVLPAYTTRYADPLRGFPVTSYGYPASAGANTYVSGGFGGPGSPFKPPPPNPVTKVTISQGAIQTISSGRDCFVTESTFHPGISRGHLHNFAGKYSYFILLLKKLI